MAGSKKEGSFAGWLQRVRKTGEHSDLIVRIQGQEFKLHTLPLVNESTYFRNNVGDKNKHHHQSSDSTSSSSSSAGSSSSKTKSRFVVINELPGGPEAFGVAADFCYIIRPVYTFSNVGPVRAAGLFLGMNDLLESIKKFLYANVFSSWRSCVSFLREFQRVCPNSDEYIESRALRIISAACTKAFVETKHVSVPINLSLTASTSTSNWQSSPSHNLKDVLLAGASLPEVYASQLLETLVSADTNLHIKCRQSRNVRDWLEYLINSECKRVRSRCWIITCLSKMVFKNSPSSRPFLELSSQFWCSLLEHAGSLLNQIDDPQALENLRSVKKQLEIRIGSSLNELDDYIQAYSFTAETLLSLVKHFMDSRTFEDDHDEEYEIQAVASEVDSCLWGYAESGNICIETFVALEEAFFPGFRNSHDMLYAAVEKFLEKNKKLSSEDLHRLWKWVDCSKLTMSVYDKAMGNPLYLSQPHVLECVLKRHGEELSTTDNEASQQNLRSIMQKVIKASLKLLEENSRRSREIKELQKQFSTLVGSGLKIHPSQESPDMQPSP